MDNISILNGGDYRITQIYGANAESYRPIGLAFHSGIDIVSKSGIDWTIEAVEDGIVEFAAWRDMFGFYVRTFNHGTRREWQYMHLEKVLCTTGQFIKQGQPIGIIGNTGNSFGRHLHLDVKIRGQNLKNGVFGCIDPLPILRELDRNKGSGGSSPPPPPGPVTPVSANRPAPAPQIINTNLDELTMSQAKALEDKINNLEINLRKEVSALSQRIDGFITRVDKAEQTANRAEGRADNAMTNITGIAAQTQQYVNQSFNQAPATTGANTATGAKIDDPVVPPSPGLEVGENVGIGNSKTKLDKLRDKPNWITTYLPGIGGISGLGFLSQLQIDQALPLLTQLTWRQIGIAATLLVIGGAFLLYSNHTKKDDTK